MLGAYALGHVSRMINNLCHQNLIPYTSLSLVDGDGGLLDMPNNRISQITLTSRIKDHLYGYLEFRNQIFW